MKNIAIVLIALSLSVPAVLSCKTVGRIAAKYWLKKEIKEFISNCEDKTNRLVGSENARKYCDCAVDIVAEKYHNYQDAKRISVMEIVDFINKCK